MVYLFLWGGTFNNHLNKLHMTINCNIKFLLNLPNVTSKEKFFKVLNVKNLKFIHNFSVLIQLYKHKDLIPIFDHDHKTRFKHNINIRLPNFVKVYGQKSVFYMGLKLCLTFNINLNNFSNVIILRNILNV